MTERRDILKIIPAAALGLTSFGIGVGALMKTSSDDQSTSALKVFDPRKQRRIPDVAGITHSGAHVNFYEDLIKDKVAVINFFSIFAEESYPVTQRLSAVATRLGDKLGRDVFMVSVTRDPWNDTPDRLAAFASRFGNFKGWAFINLAQQGTVAMNERIYHTSRKQPASHGRNNPTADIVFYGNGAVGLWSTFPVDIEPGDAARRIGWVMSAKAPDQSLKRAGPRRPTQAGLKSDNRIV